MSRRQRPQARDPQVIQFPRLRNGEVDWKTLSNILVAQVLGDVLCISYMDPKYGKKDTDFEIHTLWRYSYEKDDVVVFKKEDEDSPIHYFAGCSVINYPPEVVFDLIGLSDNVLVYEKYAEESRVVEVINSSENINDCIVFGCCFYYDEAYIKEPTRKLNEIKLVDHPIMLGDSYIECARKALIGLGMRLISESILLYDASTTIPTVYRRYAVRNCLVRAERELVFFKHAEYMPNTNKYVVAFVSVEHQSCPVSRRIKRTLLLPGCGCVLEPYNNDPSKSLVCWIAHVDLGGLPALITNHIMKQEPQSIQFITERLNSLQREGALDNQPRYLNDTDRGTTTRLPTPGTPQQEMRFSSISVGSNPLYQQSWSMSTRTPGKNFINKAEFGDRQNSSNHEGTQLVGRQISAVLEEPELEDNSQEQSTDHSKEHEEPGLIFEVSMYTKRNTLTTKPNK